MRKKTLKVLSLIVAVVMVVAMLPLSALAEETKPTRKVGVVVYGAELTEILTDMESSIDSLKDGDANLQGNLETLTELVESLGTKLADGSGISVPDVDVSLVSENGKEYKLVEDTSIEIFTETVETYIPFQNEVEEQIKALQENLDGLKEILAKEDQYGLTSTVDSANESLTGLLKQIGSLGTDLLANLGSLTGLNGSAYRTYVTEEALPIGDYTVKVNGFTDTDSEGRAVTREGYVLYNDGLGSEGSGFNTERYFDVTIEEQGLFDHEIQFVGPANGISGSINLPTSLATVYDAVVNTLNSMDSVFSVAEKAGNTVLNSWAGRLISQDATIRKLIAWLGTWNSPAWSTSENLDLSYKFVFPGLWCAESEAGFSFTDVDVAESGVTGSEFLLINRDELIDVLKLMKELGEDAVKGAVVATFGGEVTYGDGSVVTYDSIVNLYFELVEAEDGQLSLDYDTLYAIIKTYMGVLSDMNLFDRLVDTDTGDVLTPIKLKYPIPAILKATSDENGIVTFNRNSNVTLTWMLEIIPEITEKLGETGLVDDNQILSLLLQVSDYAANLVGDYGPTIVNKLVYPFAQRLGLVGKKMASGNYLMFQTAAADGYWINPLAYTMILTWENETWLYVTVADLGIIMPYFVADFYDFVRETTFAGTLDKFLSKITGDDITIITDILNDNIDITDEINQTMMGALTAFVGQIGFDSLGLDSLFATKSDFISGLNTYLYENGRTAQNLMIYVNRQAMRAKSVYAGYVTEDWYFYNIDKSPTMTATKLIDKSTKDISAAFVNETKSSIITKTGTAVSKVVNTVGTKVETTVQNIRTKIKSTIGAAVKSVVQKGFEAVKSTVSSFFKNIFSNIFNS